MGHTIVNINGYFIADANRKYRKYVGSKEFVLRLTKAISAAANVTVIRVNGIQVLRNINGAHSISVILAN